MRQKISEINLSQTLFLLQAPIICRNDIFIPVKRITLYTLTKPATAIIEIDINQVVVFFHFTGPERHNVNRTPDIIINDIYSWF